MLFKRKMMIPYKTAATAESMNAEQNHNKLIPELKGASIMLMSMELGSV